MSETNTGRGKRVTRAQLDAIWVFLSCHRNIAVGINKTLEDREKFRRLWMRIAKNINGLDGGAVRDWKGWAKYWVDYKAKLKRRASETKKIKLTEIEKKFMSLLSNQMVKQDPTFSNEEMQSTSLCAGDLQDSITSLDGFPDLKQKLPTNGMDKLVNVLTEIHKTLVRIEQKLPTYHCDVKHRNDNSSLLNVPTYNNM